MHRTQRRLTGPGEMARERPAAGAEVGAAGEHDAAEESDPFERAECEHRAAGVGRPALMVRIAGVGKGAGCSG